MTKLETLKFLLVYVVEKPTEANFFFSTSFFCFFFILATQKKTFFHSNKLRTVELAADADFLSSVCILGRILQILPSISVATRYRIELQNQIIVIWFL